MEELNQSRVSLGIHALVAAFAGYISVIVAASSRTLFAVLLGFVILYITGFIAQRLTGQKGVKWWLANGIFIYLLLWYISWTVFFNL